MFSFFFFSPLSLSVLPTPKLLPSPGRAPTPPSSEEERGHRLQEEGSGPTEAARPAPASRARCGAGPQPKPQPRRGALKGAGAGPGREGSGRALRDRRVPAASAGPGRELLLGAAPEPSDPVRTSPARALPPPPAPAPQPKERQGASCAFCHANELLALGRLANCQRAGDAPSLFSLCCHMRWELRWGGCVALPGSAGGCGIGAGGEHPWVQPARLPVAPRLFCGSSWGAGPGASSSRQKEGMVARVGPPPSVPALTPDPKPPVLARLWGRSSAEVHLCL